MPGPRPTPTYLKLLRGNPGKRKLNKNEPRPAIPPAPPPCPEFLDGYAREEWERVSGELFNLRLLTTVDTAVFAVYCNAYSRWRTATERLAAMAARDELTHGLLIKTKAGDAVANPLVYIVGHAARDMVRYAGEFGMTPAARSRINGGEPMTVRPPSKFGDLLAGPARDDPDWLA
jgi:P27 family predicted phage terminase small subunit